MLKKIILLSCCLFSFNSWLFSLDANKMQNDMQYELDTIYNHFLLYYAPLQWKEDHLKLELDKEKEKIQEAIDNNPAMDIATFRSMVRNFLFSLHDYHVAPTFLATEAAVLPFTVQEAQGRFFISWIDPTALAEETTSLAVGDEIVLWDGVPISQVINNMVENERHAAPKTDLAKTVVYLTMRTASQGMRVPQGAVTLQVKKNKSEEYKTYSLTWKYFSEKNPSFGSSLRSKKLSRSKLDLLLDSPLLNPTSIDGDFDSTPEFIESYPLPTGYHNSKIPPLGELLWHSDEKALFDAYIALGEDGRRIAFVRIATYTLPESNKNYLAYVKEFSDLIKRFEMESDLLVIDQRDNPGGAVFYAYALASTLISTPIQLPLRQIALNSDIVSEASDILQNWELLWQNKENLDGLLLSNESKEEARNFYTYLLEEWRQGNTVTPPTFFTMRYLLPHESGSYTKPLFILVNEMAGSSGDLFPALLQDNGRAVIIGERTAGAGGSVRKFSFLSLFGLAQVSYTWTLTWRADGNPIEDLGVTPDIPYALTAEDLQSNYHPFVSFLQKTIKETEPGLH